MDEVLRPLLQLVRSLPPQELEKILYGAHILLPDISGEVLQRVDRPSFVLFDPQANKFFLCCDYNRDGDTFRSPWSGTFFPDTPEHPCYMPSGPLRDVERLFNSVFDRYRAAFYQGGTSSVYVWSRQSGAEGFGAAFLIQKNVAEKGMNATWNSTHVVTVTTSHATVKYLILSTLHLKVTDETLPSSQLKTGQTDIGLMLTNKKDVQKRIAGANDDDPQVHLQVIGPAIEAIEHQFLLRVKETFVVKLQEILSKLRSSACELS